MSQAREDGEMRPEYDFSKAARGKHHKAHRRGTNVVLLDPDVAAVFKDSAAVNSALREWAKAAPQSAGAGPNR